MLSAPPETATAIRGLRSKGPSPAISRSNSAAPRGAAASAARGTSGAAGALALAMGELLHIRRRVGIARVELAEEDAGILVALELDQRHAELEERIRGLRALGIFLIALGEGLGRLIVIAAHVISLAEPVLGGAGERIVGVGAEEGREGLL